MVAKVETRDPCFICGGTEHQPQECPTLGELRGGNEEHCNALRDYKKPYNPFSNTYNPGWRNHPNFSWKDSNQASGSQWRSEQQQPPKSYIAPQNNMHSSNSLENTLQMLAQTQIASTQELKSCFTQMVEEMKDMKIQMTKLNTTLAIQEHGRLPAQPLIHKKGQHMAQASTSADTNFKEVKAIST